MKVLKYNAPRQAEVIEVPTPEPQADQMLCRSICCSISAGTEMGFYRGTAPQLNSSCDSHNNFFDAPDNITYPMQANGPGVWWMGYANVSEVIKVGSGIEHFKPGDVVFAQKGHCDHQLLTESEAVKLSVGTNPEHAAMLALAEIAFNGILDADIKLTETVVVFGLGPVGQLVLRLARMSGARVIAVDSLPNRLELAQKAGADLVVNFRKTDVVEAVYNFTGDRGADVVFEASGNIAALTTATKACCYNGRLVAVSFYQQGSDSLCLGREFHHKRIRLISSQICGICPSFGGAWTTERRRQAVLELLPQLNLDDLISSRVSFSEVPDALKLIDSGQSSCNAVIIRY